MTDTCAHLAPRPSIRLLDGFALVCGQAEVHVIPVARRLLALLALREAPMSRAVVAAALWPDVTERRAAASLRSTLWRLATPTGFLLETADDTLRLVPDV